MLNDKMCLSIAFDAGRLLKSNVIARNQIEKTLGNLVRCITLIYVL